MNHLGKDNKEFCPARYVDWVKRGRSSLKFEKFKRQRRPPKWFCDKCFQGPFIGRAISEHRKKCK